jgi:hypothetical protein
MGYTSQISGSGHSGSSNDSSEDVQEPATAKLQQDSQPPPKSDTKPQATFLTKLYAYVSIPFLALMISKLTRRWLLASVSLNAPKIIT